MFKGMGRKRFCVVCSSSQAHNFSQTVYLVMETFLLMCHEMERPPHFCAALSANPIKKTLWQSNTNKILFLLTLLVRAFLYSALQFLWWEAYLWTIIWHHVHIPPIRCSLVICSVCSPLCFGFNGRLSSSVAPSSIHTHTNIHVYILSPTKSIQLMETTNFSGMGVGGGHHMIACPAPCRKPPFLSKGGHRQCFVKHTEGVYPFY